MKFSFTLVGLAALSMFAVTEAASAMPSGLTADGGAKTLLSDAWVRLSKWAAVRQWPAL
jgi:hypothetical protein